MYRVAYGSVYALGERLGRGSEDGRGGIGSVSPPCCPSPCPSPVFCVGWWCHWTSFGRYRVREAVRGLPADCGGCGVYRGLRLISATCTCDGPIVPSPCIPAIAPRYTTCARAGVISRCNNAHVWGMRQAARGRPAGWWWVCWRRNDCNAVAAADEVARGDHLQPADVATSRPAPQSHARTRAREGRQPQQQDSTPKTPHPRQRSPHREHAHA